MKLNKLIVNSKKDYNKFKYLLYYVQPSILWIFTLFIFIFKNDLKLDSLIFFISVSLFFTVFSIFILNFYKYEVINSNLKIKIGFITLIKIPISDIVNISYKNKGHKIYGLSNDIISLKINKTQSKNREINISPIDKESFLRYLILINPNIIITN